MKKEHAGRAAAGAVDAVAVEKASKACSPSGGRSIADLKLRANASMTAFIVAAKASARRHNASTCRCPMRPRWARMSPSASSGTCELAAIRHSRSRFASAWTILRGGKRKGALKQFHRLAPCAARAPLSAHVRLVGDARREGDNRSP